MEQHCVHERYSLQQNIVKKFHFLNLGLDTVRMHPALVSVAAGMNSTLAHAYFIDIHLLLFAEVSMSSKVSKETLYEGVNTVLQVIKLFSPVFCSTNQQCS